MMRLNTIPPAAEVRKPKRLGNNGGAGIHQVDRRPLPPIVTHHDFPPIPWRDFDWVAYRDGREEEGGYGYGPTEHAAIADLLANEEAEEE